jgi:hypothetical protein
MFQGFRITFANCSVRNNKKIVDFPIKCTNLQAKNISVVLGDHDVSQEGETEAVSYAAKEVRTHPGQNRRSLLKLTRNVLSLAVPKYFIPEVVCHGG